MKGQLNARTVPFVCNRHGGDRDASAFHLVALWVRVDHRGFFLIILSGHWVFGWFAYVDEQAAHQQPIEVSAYTIQMMRDTLENWQSEFLQLLWQVVGLAMLLHVGSPESKEGDDRIETKIHAILLAVEPEKGNRLVDAIDHEYEGRHTDARFVRELERRTGSRAGSTR